MERIRQGLASLLFLFLLTSIAWAGPSGTAGVTAGGNSAGLTLILDCPNEAHVSGVAVAGAAATVNFDTSPDRTTWRTHTILLSAASGTAFIDVTVGQPFVRITSATTAVQLDFELGCKQ